MKNIQKFAFPVVTDIWKSLEVEINRTKTFIKVRKS